MLYNFINLTAKYRLFFFSTMLLNLFTVLLNNNDVRPITTELVESEISQKHKPNFYV